MTLDPKLLDILVDPITKAPLLYDRARQELVCVESALAYPVREDIPVMIEEEARRLSPEEVESWRARRG